MNLKFSGRGLAFLANYKAKQDIRYYLNGVYLMPHNGGVLGCATNGHMAGMWFDKDGQVDRPIILNTSTQLERTAAKQNRSFETMLQVIDNRLVITLDGIELYIQPNMVKPDPPIGTNEPLLPFEVSGNYPDLKRVSRRDVDLVRGPTDAMNANLLAKAAASFSQGQWRGMYMRQDMASMSVLLTSPAMPEAAAIVMPMRDDCNPIPDWFKSFIGKSVTV